MPRDDRRGRVPSSGMRWYDLIFFFHTLLMALLSGIWDCLSSQQVVDFVRCQVSEGKELTEICEMMFEHCLGPDTDSGEIGCDNMTLLVVGITHGRTKKGWYKWIKERVKSEYGYKTSGTPPQLYSPSRLLSFRQRKEAHEAREKMKATINNKTPTIPNVEVARRSQPSLVVYLTNLAGKLSAIVAK